MTKSQLLTYVYNTIIVLLLLAGVTYVVLQFTHFGRIEYTDNARVCQYIAPQNTRAQGFIKEKTANSACVRHKPRAILRVHVSRANRPVRPSARRTVTSK